MNSRTRFALFVTCILLAIGAVSYSARATDDEHEPEVATWQHLALPHNSPILTKSLSQQINRLGNEGWELVSVSPIDSNGSTTRLIFYFKRPQ